MSNTDSLFAFMYRKIINLHVFTSFIHLHTGSVDVVFKRCYKPQTRKGLLFFLFFLPPVVQGFKDHKRFIPCDLEVLASEIFSQTVKVLMKDYRNVWNSTGYTNTDPFIVFLKTLLLHNVAPYWIYLVYNHSQSLYTAPFQVKRELKYYNHHNWEQSYDFFFFVMWIFFHL